MKNSDVQKIYQWKESLDGVFTLADLQVLFESKGTNAIFKKIQLLICEKVLIKIKRGIYATADAKLSTVTNRINPSAYISTDTVLAKELIIGSVPGRKIQAVKIGRPRIFRTQMGVIEFLSIAPKLYFGFQEQEGIKYATPEKAFLDSCYFYYKGKKFPFDLDTDINRESLNQKLLEQYLLKFDKRFITFYRTRWGHYEQSK